MWCPPVVYRAVVAKEAGLGILQACGYQFRLTHLLGVIILNILFIIGIFWLHKFSLLRLLNRLIIKSHFYSVFELNLNVNNFYKFLLVEH